MAEVATFDQHRFNGSVPHAIAAHRVLSAALDGDMTQVALVVGSLEPEHRDRLRTALRSVIGVLDIAE